MTEKLRVLKFGGSSVATTDQLQRVAAQVAHLRQDGESVVVVVSAMGGTTGKLLSLAGDVTANPAPRELDRLLGTGESVSTAMLALTLGQLGVDAVSLDGRQLGIRTSGRHFNAEVLSVDTRRIRAELDAGRVVVAAGFQGISESGELTTLGLGGSDITAVVLAGALGVERVEICSDVDGVYSADPRIVDEARRIDVISYDEMVQMARHGASVLNPRAVTHASERGVEVYCRSSFEPERGGTLIRRVDPVEPRVVGVAGHDELLVVSLGSVAPGAPAHELVEGVEADDIFADGHDEHGHRHIAVPAERVPDAAAFADAVQRRGGGIRVDLDYSSVSAIGLGVGSVDHFRHSSRQYVGDAVADGHHEFSDDHSLTCVVRPAHARRIMNQFHRGFECPVEEAA